MAKRKKRKMDKRVQNKAENLRIIFEGRKNPFKGLKKHEVLALYYGRDVNTVLRYSKEKIESLWQEIKYSKKVLKNHNIMEIDAFLMKRGITISDKDFGERILERNEHIYYRITQLSDAHDKYKRLKKVAQGFEKSAEKTIEIAEETQQQQEVQQIINGVANENKN